MFRRKKAPSKPKPKVKKKPARPEALAEKGTIRGEVSYPWGTVGYATVTVGDRSTVADTAGKYEILVMNPGAYNVTAKAPFPGYEAPAQNVTVAAGETKVVDFYLDFEKTPVHGHVYGEDGKPVAGATLSGVISGKDVATAVSDDKGYFRFENASPGNQFIRVNAAGYMAGTRDFDAKKGDETKLEFHLTPASCKVHGTVLDENDRPLWAEIVLSSESGIIFQKTQSNAETGYYEFPVVPGTYGLLATASDHQSKGWRGQISSDQKLDFKLESSISLRYPATPSSPPSSVPDEGPWP